MVRGSEPFPRPHRRGRIETRVPRPSSARAALSPGLTAGGGLKQHTTAVRFGGRGFPPASPPGAD